MRSLDTLDAVLSGTGTGNVSAVARELGMPVATVHRQIASLCAAGLLRRNRGGPPMPGPRLMGLLARIDDARVLADVAVPILDDLAQRMGCVTQLGTLDGDMVTYRYKAGEGAGDLFTRIDMQLEAYCSAMGKVLLSHLPESDREAYLATGPFPPLTPKTIVDPAVLRQELVRVREAGFAVDDGEIADDLHCLAVPVCDPAGRVRAAISLSSLGVRREETAERAVVKELEATAAAIGRAAYVWSRPD